MEPGDRPSLDFHLPRGALPSEDIVRSPGTAIHLCGQLGSSSISASIRRTSSGVACGWRCRMPLMASVRTVSLRLSTIANFFHGGMRRIYSI